MRRRRLLAAAGAALATSLAGCGGGSGGGTEATDTAGPAETQAPTPGTGTQTDAPTGTETPAGTDEPTVTETPAETDTPTATPAEPPTAAQVVAVGPDFELRFAPESFEVAVGATVRWVWKSSGHNVVPETTPAGSDWSGTPGAPDRTFGEGYTYEHTFETAGSYEYYCDPHRANGMVGSFTVTE